MKKVLKISWLAILFLGIFATTSFSQKFGYINSAAILVQVPETKVADEDLKGYQAELVKKGEEMAKAFQTDYEAFATEYQSGKLPPVEAQKRQQALEKKQQEIGAYEQEVMVKLENKRQELFAPILKRVEEAIQNVGKEGSYTFIFDTSVPNTILFVEEKDDVSSSVLAKLGL
ncbi:OmpH family outer membrane protein [Saprospiraceae bacterium]|jgi:outer membrane protein|nr:OmpH family outer membrane protein [Bacteroidota bacterium]MDB4727693.1 OmpH family outer membrane protein [Saprospiraceae bacterium]MDF1863457.1 OmpH family outer membrane protein [Saprospiraceae bacterium]